MIKPQVSTQESTWRIFCAIEIPAEVQRRVLAHADHLRAAAPGVHASWTKMDNIHLTLKFFGNVELDKISNISKAADEVARHFSPIKVRVDGTGVFPKHGPARVLWIGLNDPAGMLVDLQKEFDDVCTAEGFAAEDRAFHPHLTVARLRSPQGARAVGECHKETKFEAIDFTAAELTVFRSELSSKGSKYSVISKHPLVDD
ncbi:MAG TPA: RNA 2',3'-cyclic phosphodiesterase [Pyrinomonadaceae bacterium]